MSETMTKAQPAPRMFGRIEWSNLVTARDAAINASIRRMPVACDMEISPQQLEEVKRERAALELRDHLDSFFYCLHPERLQKTTFVVEVAAGLVQAFATLDGYCFTHIAGRRLVTCERDNDTGRYCYSRPFDSLADFGEWIRDGEKYTVLGTPDYRDENDNDLHFD
jgi:hypothetical protein